MGMMPKVRGDQAGWRWSGRPDLNRGCLNPIPLAAFPSPSAVDRGMPNWCNWRD